MELQPQESKNPTTDKSKESPFDPSFEIPKELESILESLPEEDGKKVKSMLFRAVRTQQRSVTFSGPIPPPEIAAGWNDVAPNGADRLLLMAEKQLDHRLSLEQYVIKEQHKQSRRGQYFAFILALAGMGVSAFLAVKGHDIVAGTFATTLILGLVAIFIQGRKAQRKDLQDKE